MKISSSFFCATIIATTLMIVSSCLTPNNFKTTAATAQMQSRVSFVPIIVHVQRQQQKRKMNAHQQQQQGNYHYWTRSKTTLKNTPSSDDTSSFKEEHHMKPHPPNESPTVGVLKEQIPYLITKGEKKKEEKELKELEKKSKTILDELVGPLFHNKGNNNKIEEEKKAPVSQDVLQGAALAGASLSILAGSSLALASAAGLGAAYVASKPGFIGGNAVRTIGEYTWNSTNHALSHLYKKKNRKEEEEEDLIAAKSILEQTTEKKRVVGELDLSDVERVLAEANAALVEANKEVEKTQQLLLQNTTSDVIPSTTETDAIGEVSLGKNLDSGGLEEEEEEIQEEEGEELQVDVEQIIAEVETALWEANNALLLEEEEEEQQLRKTEDRVAEEREEGTMNDIRNDNRLFIHPRNENASKQKSGGVSTTKVKAAASLPFFAQEKDVVESSSPSNSFYFATSGNMKAQDSKKKEEEESLSITKLVGNNKVSNDQFGTHEGKAPDEVFSAKTEKDESSMVDLLLPRKNIVPLNSKDSRRKELALIQEFQCQVMNADSSSLEKNGVQFNNGESSSDGTSTVRDLKLAKEAVTLLEEQFHTRDNAVVKKEKKNDNKKSKKKKGKKNKAFIASLKKSNGMEKSLNNKKMNMQRSAGVDIVVINGEKRTLSWVDILNYGEEKEKGVNN